MGRSLKPTDLVDEVIEVKPERCSCCGAKLEGSDPHPLRHQVSELPVVVAQVREYQLHRLECLACGTSTGAQLPQGVPRGAFGPRVQATVSLFSGTYRVSKRHIQSLRLDCFRLDMALGSISSLEATTSQTVAEPVEEAKSYVQGQQAANLDETGWCQENRPGCGRP